MTGETTNNFGQQLCRGFSAALSYSANADDDMNIFCVQTGEEFSKEFLHDRVVLRKETVHNQPGNIGFNHNQNPQIIYHDPSGINRLRIKNSDCNIFDFVPGTVHGYQVENRAFLHSISRCNPEYSHNGCNSGRYGGEMTTGDRVASSTTISPKFEESSSQFFQPFETGVSGSTFSEKMKLLCSFGGRILPRTNDGKLRYVGGETRIISIRKNIRWEELVKKTSAICKQPHTIKYQLPAEDLDALISVCSDEDLHHLIEEYQQVERDGGSQRLRIFLVPTSEQESPKSSEGNAHRQADSGYQYVIAVNGMVDYGLVKNYSEQSLASQTTQFGSALDYSPSFPRESPTTAYLDSPTSSKFAGTYSNPAAYFFTPHSVQGKHLSQSPPLSPVAVQDMDYTNSNVLSNFDTLWQDGDQSIRDSPVDKALFDRHYRPDTSSYYNNIANVSLPLINTHHPHQYKVESGQRTEALEMPFHNRSPSGEFPANHFLSQSHLSSDRIIERTFSGSRLEGLDKGSKSSFEDACIAQSPRNRGREKSPSLVLSKSSKEGPNQQEPIAGEINQAAKCENECSFKTLETINFNKEELKGRKMALNTSNEEGKPCEGYNEAASDDKVTNGKDLKDFKDRTCALYHHQQDSQELIRRVCSTTVNALEDSERPKSEEPHFPRSSSGNADIFVHGQFLRKTKQSESVADQPVSHMLPRTTFSVSLELEPQQNKNQHSKSVTRSASSREASLCDGVTLDNPDCKIERVSNKGHYYEGPGRRNFVSARHSQSLNDEWDSTVEESEVTGIRDSLSLQSQPLKGDQENIMLESVIIVEDVTGTKLLDNLTPSTVVPLVEEEPADEFQFDGVTEAESTDLELESEILGSFGIERDELITDATMAEIEAGIYGLQIIRNSDIEEMAELGSGTFGAVYHGKWRGTDVAIKRIKDSCFSGRSSEKERLIKDFWREARILSTLHHPNVLAFYGLVPDGPGGTMATVTEYLVDGSLRRVLQKKGRALDRRRKLALALDAAFGMEYLHMKDIIHFDLKCDNLLVNLKDSQRPICKVADFGLSKIKRNTFVSGGVRGTLPWIAPELLDGSSNRVCEKVDVYSFGIAMWEIETGEEPYADMHCGAIIGGIVSNKLRPPIPGNCDPEWRKLMEKCWSSDPAARPSFTEITKKLRAMLTAIQPKRHNLVGR